MGKQSTGLNSFLQALYVSLQNIIYCNAKIQLKFWFNLQGLC